MQDGRMSSLVSGEVKADYVSEREPLLHVQPWSVTNLCVTDVVFAQVLAELIGCALERRDGLEHRNRQLEERDVLDQRGRVVVGLQKVRQLCRVIGRQR